MSLFSRIMVFLSVLTSRTSRNLHSHYHEAPLTRKHYQVTGYGIVSEQLECEQDIQTCGAWLSAMWQNTSSLEFWNVPKDWGLYRDFVNIGNFLARFAVGKATYDSVCLSSPIITRPFLCFDT